ncbi:polymer-forming cytoskeletal protein [Pelagibius litoralis]|uniref:Polymer-forming cytoskeletal protein n=1 Tax=Pelagibius litoralis TaxID=374515 RepID=A0A967KD05_9PROT|nr:polymer-forming cytoskeletal protein [Pelagibius litoralis]NIA71982.1 polymer-forming cytoskeletal protein [Pelagibius litoralis]
MFGKRKGPGGLGETPTNASADTMAQSGGDDAGGGRASGSGTKQPLGVAGIKAPRRQDPRNPGAVEGRKLVVGREICLSGEIKTCEKLVVEGRVEADLNDSQSLEISEPGLFKGHATVEDCEVYGTFEGELTVTGCLVIRSTGRVSGKIRYADIEITRGGRLSGDIDVLEASLKGRLRGERPKLAHSSDGSHSDGNEPQDGNPKSQAG